MHNVLHPKSVFSYLGAFALLAVIVGMSAYVVTSANAARHSPTVTTPQLYVVPAKATLVPGSTFTVQIRENSTTNPVNAVQANLVYPTDKLTFASLSDAGSAYGVAAEGTNTPGLVKIARGNTTAVTGDQLVATVSFTVSGHGGQAALTFDPDSALITSVNNTNILGASIGGTYRVGK